MDETGCRGSWHIRFYDFPRRRCCSHDQFWFPTSNLAVVEIQGSVRDQLHLPVRLLLPCRRKLDAINRAVDALGGIVSALSLAFATEAIDPLATASYVGPPFFEFILFGMALYYNPRAKKRRAAESASVPLGDENRVEATLEEKREREGLEGDQSGRV